MKSNKRLKIFHTSGSEEVPSASISDLPNDLLKHCFSFIPGSYITIAPVSRHFFSNYCTVGVPELANVNSADNLLKIDQNKMTTAFGVSSVELTELAILSNAPSKFIHRVCYRAALNDRKDIIDCALLYRVDFTEVSHDNFFGKLLLKLAKKGDLDMIKYIDNNFGKSFKSYLYVWRGIYRGAASKTHMHILKWLLERYPEFSLGADPFDGRQIRNVPFCDAVTVSVDVLQWTKENIEGFRFTEMIFRAASYHGNLEVLQYCHRNKCPSSQRSVGSCLLNKNKA
ncbi:predicted protein [Chaetoceros tenuissimus]|uniref:Uncharacterized protein n=1 Tax=Chaetoceros tenuissimus TaxID=426638 RepID=A0AAD3H277_9STRA|nr:predicted protein [Chaetoceros tenuissimus]